MMESFRRPEAPIAKQLGLVISDIEAAMQAGGPDAVINAPREYRVRKSITPREIESLAQLPFEVELSEHAAGLTLHTGHVNTTRAQLSDGTKEHFNGERNFDDGRFTLHNHPKSFVANPSQQDMRVAVGSAAEIEFIAAKDGLSIHRAAGESLNETMPVRRAIALLRGGEHAIRYDEAHGFIDAWITWDDPRLQLVCDYMNGEMPWSEYATRLGTPTRDEEVEG